MIENATIYGTVELESHENEQYMKCYFDGCMIKAPDSPDKRSIIRNIEMRDIYHNDCWLSGAVLENISICNLRAMGKTPLFIKGCVFNRVTLSGDISSIKINRSIDPLANDSSKVLWDEANINYYKNVAWALDIRKAAFSTSPSLEAVPGSLILRNPETTALLSKDKLYGIDWEKLDFKNTAYDIAISWFLGLSLFDDCVLVAAKRNKRFKDQLLVLNNLKAKGLAS